MEEPPHFAMTWPGARGWPCAHPGCMGFAQPAFGAPGYEPFASDPATKIGSVVLSLPIYVNSTRSMCSHFALPRLQPTISPSDCTSAGPAQSFIRLEEHFFVILRLQQRRPFRLGLGLLHPVGRKICEIMFWSDQSSPDFEARALTYKLVHRAAYLGRDLW